MKENYNHKEINLENGKTYIVIREIAVDDKLYVYAINKENKFDGNFFEIVVENEMIFTIEVDDENIIEKIVTKLVSE